MFFCFVLFMFMATLWNMAMHFPYRSVNCNRHSIDAINFYIDHVYIAVFINHIVICLSDHWKRKIYLTAENLFVCIFSFFLFSGQFRLQSNVVYSYQWFYFIFLVLSVCLSLTHSFDLIIKVRLGFSVFYHLISNTACLFHVRQFSLVIWIRYMWYEVILLNDKLLLYQNPIWKSFNFDIFVLLQRI